jgi:methionine-S-sulfoxide reductase
MLKAWTLSAMLALSACASAAEDAVKIPAPAVDQVVPASGLRKAVVAGGCFWGVQGVYQHLDGVHRVLSGYAGGQSSTADYESVSGGDSGHAESVEILYDPGKVTYGQILQVFFSVVHDPTQLDRQGPDTGPQYRSAIFYGNAEEKKIAEAYIAQLDRAGAFGRRIVTRVDPLRGFYPAEDYHQDYLLNHPRNPYIVVNDLPKVRNFQKLFPALYRADPVTVAESRESSPGMSAQGAAMMSRGSAPSMKRGSAPSMKPGSAPSMSREGAPAMSSESGPGMMSAKPADSAAPSAAGGAMMSVAGADGPAKTEGALPALDGATGWLNSPPLTRESLRGKVVLVDFWAYSCINCLRTFPYINAWYRHYKDSGLVILGVHSPEFAFEKDTGNVEAAIEKFEIRYPVVLDNNLALWKAFNNRFWPAHYFVDAKGQIRGHHFGEGKYARSERMIRQLLMEAGAKNLPEPLDDAAGEGVTAPSNTAVVASPETYIGYERAENFASTGGLARDRVKAYALPQSLALNEWALAGSWAVAGEHARLQSPGGRIAFRFKARDLHLVLGPAQAGKAIRFRITVNGAPPNKDSGVDVDAKGNGVVREHRLYNLVRFKGPVAESDFVIEFLDPGVDAFSFTFG